MHTWEEAIKFHSGLTIGMHCVTLASHSGQKRNALVEITNRGAVYLLAEPSEGCMYSSWSRIRGDRQEDAGKGRNGTIVWGARDPAFKARFAHPTTTVRRV